jgi:glycosyltransferase involved in cell wall biosynthesis
MVISMIKIRLFVDGHVFDGPNQGTTTFIRGLYSSLERLGFPFEILIGAQSENLLEKEPTLGEKIKLVRYRTHNRYVRLGVEIPAIIRKYRIDYAHFQYFCPFVKNCRWIVTIHDLLFNDFPDEFPLSYRLLRNALFRYSARMAEINTTVSEYSRHAIERDFGVPADQVHILPNGVDAHFFEPYSREESQQVIRANYGVERYLLYVSRLEPRKNHALLARAFFELGLDRQGYQLVFVGRCSLDTPELDQLLGGLTTAQRAAFHHFENVHHQDLMNFYKGAELFVYPSKAEGFGIPPIEAAALGIPTLCSNATAMADFQFFGDALFTPDNITELKEKIVRVLSRGDEGRSYADAVRKAIQSRYSWDGSAHTLGKLIMSDWTKRKK